MVPAPTCLPGRVCVVALAARCSGFSRERSELVTHSIRLVNYDKMAGLWHADESHLGDVPRQLLSVFEPLEFVVLAPENARWSLNLQQQRGDLGRQVGIESRRFANEGKLADFRRVGSEEAMAA
jgi:hypothetical protein